MSKKAERNEERLSLDKLKNSEDFKELSNIFINARQNKRKFVAYLGPTNSGKTHNAMEALKNASNGTYLAPLRLMALENYERLKDAGVSAGLRTGEEVKDLDGSTHTCQTIETADFNKCYEVAVIDEIQLLTDVKRGGFWLNAFFGIAADTVYLCGAAFVEPLLRELVAITGEELTVHKTERKSPLTFSEKPESSIRLPEAGTAFVAFSRRSVLAWKEAMEEAGVNVSVIYGALSPEVRREQSRRFREGETKYLIATDAIGMGLNLPIKKIIFTEAQKYDGEDFRHLGVQEVKQIGGRAGRYGFSDEAGIVSSYSQQDLNFLGKRFYEPDPTVSLSDVHVRPTFMHVKRICEEFGDYGIEKALIRFQKMGHDTFSVAISDDELLIARKLDHIFGTDYESLQDRWLLSIAPVDTKDDWSMDYFLSIATQYKKSRENQKSIKTGITAADGSSLEKAESVRKSLTLYLWLALKDGRTFDNEKQAKELARHYDEKIDNLLSKNSKKEKKVQFRVFLCKKCKTALQPGSKFDTCRDCAFG